MRWSEVTQPLPKSQQLFLAFCWRVSHLLRSVFFFMLQGTQVVKENPLGSSFFKNK